MGDESGPRDADEVDPLEAFMGQFASVPTGELLAAAAEYNSAAPEHVAAWAEVHRVAAAHGMEPEIDRLRRRVGQWVTHGTGVTAWHLGVGPADEFNLTARAAAAGAVVDGGVVEMLGRLLTDDAIRALLRAWGLPEVDEPPEPDAPDEP